MREFPLTHPEAASIQCSIVLDPGPGHQDRILAVLRGAAKFHINLQKFPPEKTSVVFSNFFFWLSVVLWLFWSEAVVLNHSAEHGSKAEYTAAKLLRNKTPLNT